MYNEDYYERGIQAGLSLYENYHWMPELTIPMAMTIIDYLGIRRGDTVLDFGCAKGYLVKALRWLGRDAYGYDVSEYAVHHGDSEVVEYISTDGWNRTFDYVIAKDVLEHIDEDAVAGVVHSLSGHILLAIVPLGDGQKYNVEAYEMDVTHKIRQPLPWWVRTIESAGWSVTSAVHSIRGIKDNWSFTKNGNGFITASR